MRSSPFLRWFKSAQWQAESEIPPPDSFYNGFEEGDDDSAYASATAILSSREEGEEEELKISMVWFSASRGCVVCRVLSWVAVGCRGLL